jgi:pimeloyl-ACP methyl ester carboxylesterase
MPVALPGVSMGGATAIRAAAQRPEVDAVISISAFASVDRMMGHGMTLMGAPDWLAKV